MQSSQFFRDMKQKPPICGESKRHGRYTDEGWDLATMECCKNGLGTIGWEISFDHCYSARQARVCSWCVSCIFFLYILDWECRVKRHPNWLIVVDEAISRTDIYLINIPTSYGYVGISWYTGESIADLIIPVLGWEYGWFRWWISEGCCITSIGSGEYIDSWECQESEYGLQELDSIVARYPRDWMFHTFTKRTKQL